MKETLELLHKGQRELEAALECLPDETKADYTVATNAAGGLVMKESPPMRFLRATRFDATAAALLLVTYWKERKTLFGERAFRLMTHTGRGAMTAEDVKILKAGYLAILSKDQKGRIVLLFDDGRGGRDRHSPGAHLSYLRCAFYILQVASENEACRKAGLVLLRRSCRGTVEPDNIDNSFWSIPAAFPVDLKAFHLIFLPPSGSARIFSDTVIPTLPKTIRDCTLCHEETSPRDVFLKLKKFDLDQQGLPTSLGGNWSYENFSLWRLHRLCYERDVYERGHRPIPTPDVPVATRKIAPGSSGKKRAHASSSTDFDGERSDGPKRHPLKRKRNEVETLGALEEKCNESNKSNMSLKNEYPGTQSVSHKAKAELAPQAGALSPIEQQQQQQQHYHHQQQMLASSSASKETTSSVTSEAALRPSSSAKVSSMTAQETSEQQPAPESGDKERIVEWLQRELALRQHLLSSLEAGNSSVLSMGSSLLVRDPQTLAEPPKSRATNAAPDAASSLNDIGTTTQIASSLPSSGPKPSLSTPSILEQLLGHFTPPILPKQQLQQLSVPGASLESAIGRISSSTGFQQLPLKLPILEQFLRHNVPPTIMQQQQQYSKPQQQLYPAPDALDLVGLLRSSSVGMDSSTEIQRQSSTLPILEQVLSHFTNQTLPQQPPQQQLASGLRASLDDHSGSSTAWRPSSTLPAMEQLQSDHTTSQKPPWQQGGQNAPTPAPLGLRSSPHPSGLSTARGPLAALQLLEQLPGRTGPQALLQQQLQQQQHLSLPALGLAAGSSAADCLQQPSATLPGSAPLPNNTFLASQQQQQQQRRQHPQSQQQSVPGILGGSSNRPTEEQEDANKFLALLNCLWRQGN